METVNGSRNPFAVREALDKRSASVFPALTRDRFLRQFIFQCHNFLIQPPARNGKDYPWPIPACFRAPCIPDLSVSHTPLCARCNRRGLQPVPCLQI